MKSKGLAAVALVLALAWAGGAVAQLDLLAEPPLIQAVQQNDLDSVRDALTLGRSPRVTSNNGTTALTIAVESASAAIVRALLEAGALPGLADRQGETPLHAAAQCGHTGVAYMLLRSGAKVDDPADDGTTRPLQALPAVEGCNPDGLR